MQSPTQNSCIQPYFHKHSPFCKLSASSKNESDTPRVNIKLRDLKNFQETFIANRKNLFSFSQLVLSDEIHNLVVSNNNIQDFNGFPNLQNLETLDISDNPISSLRCFPILPKLHEISLYHTPFSQTQYFRLALICLCGKSLQIINGQRITNSERQLCSQYQPGTSSLVRSGWIFSYPPPSKEEMIKFHSKISSQKRSTYEKSQKQPIIVKRSIKKQSEIYKIHLEEQEEKILDLELQIEILHQQLLKKF